MTLSYAAEVSVPAVPDEGSGTPDRSAPRGPCRAAASLRALRAPGRRSAAARRHGTLTLFGCFDVATGNYQAILGAVSQPAGDNAPGYGDLLGALAYNVIALLAMPAAFFGLAWARFMREDIR